MILTKCRCEDSASALLTVALIHGGKNMGLGYSAPDSYEIHKRKNMVWGISLVFIGKVSITDVKVA